MLRLQKDQSFCFEPVEVALAAAVMIKLATKLKAQAQRYQVSLATPLATFVESRNLKVLTMQASKKKDRQRHPWDHWPSFLV